MAWFPFRAMRPGEGRLRTSRRAWIAVFLCFYVASLAPAESVPQVDKVRVLKKVRSLQLLHGDTVVKTYKIALGGSPVGTKAKQGDGKTPEGTYVLDGRNAQSQFYKSIHISYPNAQDRARARQLGVAPGGDIFLHGLGKKYGWVGSAHALHDWTNGCIAVTNQEIDEIWKLVNDGTPIEIRP
jgi:murein L,D-transpeptidase YafK